MGGGGAMRFKPCFCKWHMVLKYHGLFNVSIEHIANGVLIKSITILIDGALVHF